MAKYKQYSYAQEKFIPVFFDKQILPGSFEYTLSYLIDKELDLTVFNSRFKNDETGAPAYDPKILLKIILYAYSKGIVSSRRIAQCCKENIIFMALSADTCPHFTTIADFVATMDKEIVHLFIQILMVCDHEKLIGKEMFAIDGCKLPSNAGKELSGTRADFEKKVTKMQKAISHMLKSHREQDKLKCDGTFKQKEEQYIEKLKKQTAKIKEWLSSNDDKIGKSGKPIKSNITDNESAKMKTSKGYIQGYVGVASVDKKNQIVVNAEAFGQGQEQNLLAPTIEAIRENFKNLDEQDILKKAKLTADAGYHSEENMKLIFTEEIDAYIADNQFRKRDPRFSDYDRYKDRHKKKVLKQSGSKKLFTVDDFIFPEDLSHCICPAGKRLYRSGANVAVRNFKAFKFKGAKSSCVPCSLRSRCLRYPERTKIRQVAYFTGRSAKGSRTFTEKMKHKIDSTAGRAIYGLRLAIAEPPFANIRSALGLNRFTLRGKKKVNIQWNLFCIVHNLKKIHRYGEGFA
jgi:transposase